MSWAATLAGTAATRRPSAQQIGGGLRNVIGGAVSSISSGITGLIMRTTSWREALANVGTTILTGVVDAIVQLGVRWVASQLLMAVAGKAITAASTAASAPIAAAQSALWATPAALASIATLGAADAIGLAALTGAVASGHLLAALPGFSGGGYTGETGGVVHKREYVFSAPAVSNIGLGTLDAMHRGALAAGAPPASGGGEAPGGRPLAVHNWTDREEMMRYIQRHPEQEHHIVDVMRRRRGEILDS